MTSADLTTPDAVRSAVRAFLDENFDRDIPLRTWLERLADSGWGTPQWPTEWFGKGLSTPLAAAAFDEFRKVKAPGPPAGLGRMLAAPTIIAHASDEVKKRYVRAILVGDDAWCQLFSEPGAGSDLASLQTRAELDGDEYVGAGSALGFPSSAPAGRRIKEQLEQSVGEFIDSQRGGAVAAASAGAMVGRGIDQLVDLANERGRGEDVNVRQQIARLYTLTKLNGWNGLRAKEASKSGGGLSPAASLGKLMVSHVTRQWRETAMTIAAGDAMLAGSDGPMDGGVARQALFAPAPSIYGGSDQVQRNIIGERVLGLPKDPDISRDVPFRELRVGTQSKSAS